jgi:hypothetical protein
MGSPKAFSNSRIGTIVYQADEPNDTGNIDFDSSFPPTQLSTNATLDLHGNNDDLHLASIPWMDIDMDLATDNGDLTVPYDIHADLLPSSDSPAPFERWYSATGPMQPNVYSRIVRDQDSSDKSLMQPQGTLESNNDAITTPKPASLTSLTPEDKKELCIQRLTDLSASLMKNLNRFRTCTLATSFVFTASDNNTAEYLFKTMDGSSSQDNAIGKMLQSTEEFVQILKEFRETLLDVAPPPYSAKDEERREQESCSDLEDQQMQSTVLNTEEETVRRWELLHTYKNHTRHQTLTSQSEPALKRPPNAKLSIHSTLILLTCYISILRSFENIFSSLQQWLSIPFTSALRQHLAPTVADFQINGFALDGYSHRNLQFKILVQVCQHMFDTLEKAVWVDDYDGNGVIADSGFRVLLSVVLKEEGLDDGDSTGIGRIRKLLENTVKMLK